MDQIYNSAKSRYAAFGVDTEAAMAALKNVPVSIHCWQGDDITGLENSGEALSGLRDTTVVGANVEQSNTDVASEFSKMIVTQQAYSANTRVVTTGDEMEKELLNLIR